MTDTKDLDLEAEFGETPQRTDWFDRIWKLALLAALFSLSVVLYLHSLNTRYTLRIDEQETSFILDKRTGVVYVGPLGTSNKYFLVDPIHSKGAELRSGEQK